MSFLRRLRYQLILGGEKKRHGFFMLAEMLLIIAGITAALQLDAWKKDVDERNTEVILLKQLKNEFSQIKLDIYEAYRDLDAKHILLYKLYTRCGLSSELLSNDSIATMFDETMSTNDFILQHGVLDEALNTGRVSIIKNDELRILLYSWIHSDHKVNSTLSRFNKLMDKAEDVWFKKIPSRNVDYDAFPTLGIASSELANDPNSIFQDLYFENTMGYLHGINEQLYEKYADEYLVPANRILEIINQELESATPTQK